LKIERFARNWTLFECYAPPLLKFVSSRNESDATDTNLLEQVLILKEESIRRIRRKRENYTILKE